MFQPPTPTTRTFALRVLAAVALISLAALGFIGVSASPATAQAATTTPTVTVEAPTAPAAPGDPNAGESNPASISINPGDTINNPSQSLTIIVLLTLISVAPSLLIMMTSFTRIVVVLSLTRNALGLQSIPPNQVVVGLALFLSFFVMSPTLTEMNEVAIKPYLAGEMRPGEAWEIGQQPLKKFMFAQTREDELAMFIGLQDGDKPTSADDVPLTTLAPAFILSELKTAFIIGFIVFVPFLVIDLVTSASLMSLGMMMLPPTLIALPFKLLLFVLVDGWSLVVKSLLESFKT